MSLGSNPFEEVPIEWLDRQGSADFYAHMRDAGFDTVSHEEVDLIVHLDRTPEQIVFDTLTDERYRESLENSRARREPRS